jgi:hypothetical protein
MDSRLPQARLPRAYFREPIEAIEVAARYLDEAVTSHLDGDSTRAEELIRLADIPAVRDWCESLWGKSGPYVQYQAVSGSPVRVAKELRKRPRMPTTSVMAALLARDGYHCRFCGIPVIRGEVRKRIAVAYPQLAIWGRSNKEQHAAFQTMWVQYDHILPYTRGGSNELDNLVVTCAPCNFGRMQYTLEEVALVDPRTREPVRTTWDGLERFI